MDSPWFCCYIRLMTSPPFLQSPLLGCLPGINHGFFTRRGGVSQGQFDSLNCGQYSGDRAQYVLENRARVVAALDCERMVSLRQVHGSTVHEIGAKSHTGAILEGDGMVTRETGVALGVLAADCAPVLFFDPQNRVVGAAHAGWKGAVAGVTDQVVAAMGGLGARSCNISAVIGPAIQPRSYEVGIEFADRVLSRSGAGYEGCFTPATVDHKRMFDLPLYIERRLQKAGVTQIHRMFEDTCSNERQFFSYRRACHQGEKRYGRQVGAICLSKTGRG